MIKKNDKNKLKPFRKEEFSLLNYILDHKRKVMPIALIVCLCLTLIVAAHARNRDNSNLSSDSDSGSVSANDVNVSADSVSMEVNVSSEITQLINSFYTAQADGDVDTISSLSEGLTEAALIRFEVSADYIDSFDNIKVYSKEGPESGSYVVYVYYEEKFTGYDTGVPGLASYYVRSNDEGSLYLYFGEMDDSITEYIAELNLQDDYIDLSNEVSVAFNTMVENDPDLETFLTDLSETLTQAVGKELASTDSASTDSSSEASSDSSTDNSTDSASTDSSTDNSTDSASTNNSTKETSNSTTTDTKLRATDVVNIRSSASTDADVLGKTTVGDEYTLIETLDNGWSKIEYSDADDGVGYVKTEYFEEVTDDTDSDTDTTTNTSSDSDNSSSSGAVTSEGTYHVKETVRIRSSASTSSDIEGVAYEGDEIEVTSYRADGWCKVNYNGTVGYVKTEYLEK